MSEKLSPEVSDRTKARLLSWVELVPFSECWYWMGAVDRAKGYGRTGLVAGTTLAHRAMYMAFVGPIPAGLSLDHLCRMRSCVRPSHLEPVTNRENVLRGVGLSAMAAKRTACSNGHPYGENNTYFVSGSGERRCRACWRERWRRKHGSHLATGAS